MFRNAIASSSKLPLPRSTPAAQCYASFATSSRFHVQFFPSSQNAQSTLPTLRKLIPSLDMPPPSTLSSSTPTVRPPRSSSLSSSHTSARTIPSLSSSRSTLAPAAPKFRWDPTPPTDETPTTHILTASSTRNNLLLTLSDRQGPVFPTITGGTGKTFKNAGRSGYEAGHQAALKMFEQVLELAAEAPRVRGGLAFKIRLALKGFNGQGMEAFMQALAGNEGTDVRKVIARVEDRTGVKIGGTRARKPRRL